MTGPLPLLEPRKPDAHKGCFGNALIIGGSRGMSGAIAMSGMAAVRAGAGLVRLAVPDCCVETVASFSPCAMIFPISRQDSNGRLCGLTDHLLDWVKTSDCIAIGPGLGRSAMLDQTVIDLLIWLKAHAPEKSLVIDADALNALANAADWKVRLPKHTVLTPHPGEWARLSGVSARQPEKQAVAAQDFSKASGATVVLKGHQTFISGFDRLGEFQTIRNLTGTPAMATGGSGDVLTGVITALMCQGMGPLEAAWLGVYVHGLAGQLAEAELKSHVVLPTELIQCLPSAFRQARSAV